MTNGKSGKKANYRRGHKVRKAPPAEYLMGKLMLAGRPWRVVLTTKLKDVVGECDLKHKVIRLAPHALPSEMFGTLLHEVLHAELPDLCEESVMRTETALTAAIRLLWGVRSRRG